MKLTTPDFQIIPPLCIPIGGQPSWNYAPAPNIQNCVSELTNANTRIWVGGGPSNCVQTCCDMTIVGWGAEVLLCNDVRPNLSSSSHYPFSPIFSF
jgi:hypothetical protein